MGGVRVEEVDALKHVREKSANQHKAAGARTGADHPAQRVFASSSSAAHLIGAAAPPPRSSGACSSPRVAIMPGRSSGLATSTGVEVLRLSVSGGRQPFRWCRACGGGEAARYSAM